MALGVRVKIQYTVTGEGSSFNWVAAAGWATIVSNYWDVLKIQLIGAGPATIETLFDGHAPTPTLDLIAATNTDPGPSSATVIRVYLVSAYPMIDGSSITSLRAAFLASADIAGVKAQLSGFAGGGGAITLQDVRIDYWGDTPSPT